MSFAGTPGSVRDIRTAIAQLAHSCGFREEKVEAIKLAVSEAATNSILHGYSDRSGTITVAAELEAGGVLRVVIADEGRGDAAAPRKRWPRLRRSNHDHRG
jgi:stage II sporulation protein AB (anti-sigma F factor)